jgi:hypothetical protein
VTAPLYGEPVLGWRVWHVRADALELIGGNEAAVGGLRRRYLVDVL